MRGEYTKEQARRDIDPHKAAVAAMWMYGAEYARQGHGAMGFWDRLDEGRKRVCRDLVARMADAPDEPK